MTEPKKKLIEVALPLEAINKACKPETENPFLQDHPRAIHVWWARTPLVACRAFILASLLDDPAEADPGQGQTDVSERERLFRLIEQVCRWDATGDHDVLAAVKKLLGEQFTDAEVPALLDPFSGRGSIPLEARRLGMEAWAYDLNPVAVLMNEALLTVPARFREKDAISNDGRLPLGGRKLEGLIQDVRYYGSLIQERLSGEFERLYPKVEVDGRLVDPHAWIWCRVVKCPNPACGISMPLTTSHWLSKRSRTWLEPTVDADSCRVRYRIVSGQDGEPPPPTKTGRGASFRCPSCGDLAPEGYVREQGRTVGFSQQLLAAVIVDKRGRRYVECSHEALGAGLPPVPSIPEDLSQPLSENTRWFSPPVFGMRSFDTLFNSRQLLVLLRTCQLIHDTHQAIHRKAVAHFDDTDDVPLSDGGSGARAYADSVCLYLALALGRLTDYSSTLATWNPTNENIRNLFQRQAIPMTWDYAEANLVGGQLTFATAVQWVVGALTHVPASDEFVHVDQHDARKPLGAQDKRFFVCTDPPYFDNIGYSELADFFYVWLRRGLAPVGGWEKLFSTLLTPKSAELVASGARYGGSSVEAEQHFRSGFDQAVRQLIEVADPDLPMVFYYAHKQQEGELAEGARASTGWDTMLSGLLQAGLQVTATWPVRTTKRARSVARGTNALASAIVIACRPRPSGASMTTRREYVRALSSTGARS